MSALLLARAARLLGWPPERWGRGWPDLLTAAEIATIEACDETGKPDPGKRAAILALLETMGPDADGQAPGNPPRMVARQSSYLTGPAVAPRYDTPAPMVPAYRAATYRQWPPRDWEPGPMVAQWLEWFDVMAAMPPDGQKPEPKPAKHEPRQTEINRLLRDTWEAEGCPGGAAFFRKLKAYKGQPGSPIREWWQAGEKAGIEYETSAGVRKELKLKAIQNKISEWKKTAAPDKP